MPSAVIGALRVFMSADTAAFNKGLTDAEKRAEAFGRVIGGQIRRSLIGLGAAAAAVAGPAALGMLTRSSMETIDAQSKLAKRVGASVEAIQVLQHAAELAGVGQEQLSKALDMLNARLGEAAREGAGPAYEALQRLGIAARDLAAMDADERIKLLSDRMKELGYTTQQQADVLRQFGIRGGELINLFQEGSAAINQARRDLEAWGVTVSDVDAAKIEAANDAISRIGTVMQGVGNQLAVNLSPYLEAVAQGFTDAARESHGFSAAIQSSIQTSVHSVTGLLDWLQKVQFLLKTIETTAAGIDLRAAEWLPWRNDEVDGLREQFRALHAEMKTMAETPLASEAFDEWMAKAKEAARIRTMFDVGFGPNPGRGDAPDPQSEADAKEAAALQEKLAQRLATLQESLLTEREAELNAYAQRMTDLADFYNQNLITKQEYDELAIASQRDYVERIKDLDEETAKSAQKAAQMRSRALNDILGDVKSIISSVFGDSKGAAIAMALIDTAQAVTKTLAQYGATPWGFAAAASAAAAGAAQIAAIRRTNLGGGGSVAPVGSSGGGGTAASSGSSGAASGADQTLFINGLTTGSLFSAESVRELAEKLIEFQRDGGKVVLSPA